MLLELKEKNKTILLKRKRKIIDIDNYNNLKAGICFIYLPLNFFRTSV